MSKIPANKVVETIGKYMLVDIIPVIADLDKSHGNIIVDANSGKEYLDCFSYIASNPIGHNHPALSEPEFEKKLLRASKSKPSNSDFYSLEMAEFVDTFASIAKPNEFKHLFFVEGGAMAVENALKAAFDWKVRKNNKKGIKENLGSKIIHFQQAFHGRSGYTLSLTNTADPRKIKLYPKFDWPRIVNPKIHFPLDTTSLEQVINLEKQAIEQILAVLEQDGDDIAAIIIEPIQGEGGDNHFRTEFHQALRKIASENEVLLIYDEVQSGLGLTGKMWAYQNYSIVPDIVCFGKKTQVCGIMVSDRIDEVENNVFKEVSRINSTWGGGLTDMVRCQKYLEVIHEENLVDNARDVGNYFLEQLENSKAVREGILDNPRGKGLMCAVDAKDSESRDKIFLEIFKQGVIILKCGMKSLRFRPSLNFTKTEIDKVIRAIENASIT